jgi:membrane protein DedA with SNARE-associated domain
MPEFSQFLQHFSYMGLFILLIMGGIGFPFPEDAILIMSGFLIFHDIMKPVPALVTIYAGLLLTDYFLYFMGKKYGRMIVTHKKFHKIISPAQLSKLEKKFEEKGSLLIFVGRHVVGLRAQLLVVAGVTKMPAVKFLIVDGITSVFTIALMVGAGYMGGNSLQVIRKDISRVEHIVILLLVIIFSFFMVSRYFKNRGNRTV